MRHPAWPTALTPPTRLSRTDVVADVANYKLFVPYCEDSVVERRLSNSLFIVSVDTHTSVTHLFSTPPLPDNMWKS